jgi:hypothetical protein
MTEDALTAPPERTELWFDFHDHWEDRALAVDDEPSELRWPDPDRTFDDLEIIDRAVAEPACAKHGRALSDCSTCDALHCVECGGEDYCAACFSVVIGTLPTEPPTN